MMTTEEKLAQATMLLREALISLREMADKAGDVPEWNENGSYYNLTHDIRDFLRGETGNEREK